MCTAEPEKTINLPALAKAAEIQPDTLRMWYRRGYLGDQPTNGWRRYTIYEAAQVAFYARVLKLTKNHEIADKSLSIFKGYFAALKDGVGVSDLWLVFKYRSYKSALECDEIEDEVEVTHYIRDLINRDALFGEPVCPLIVPVHDVWASVIERVAFEFGIHPVARGQADK